MAGKADDVSENMMFWQEVGEGRRGRSQGTGGWPSLSAIDEASRWRHTLLPCRHWRQRFELEGGIAVFASAWYHRPKEEAGRAEFTGDPDIGFYLDRAWLDGHVMVSPGFHPPFVSEGRQRIVMYPWRDYALPQWPKVFVRALTWLLAEARRGKVVEIGCAGGHGRTGTTLACLLVLQGVRPKRAVTLVRSRHCEEAIESTPQLEFIASLA